MVDSWLSFFNKNDFNIHENSHASNMSGVLDPIIEANLPVKDGEHACSEIRSWENYKPTPLHRLDSLAEELNVSHVLLKDESSRFGLGSFKALGGAYAVYRVITALIAKKSREKNISSAELESGAFNDIIKNITVITATDGNHGKSVAWGAQRFGCNCKIYLHSGVSQGREDAIASYGCDIIRVDGDYDHSVRQADKDAHKNGWHVVSDTSYTGYREIPGLVMQGYTLMASEIAQQTNGSVPTHLFLPGGVGGVAAAISAQLWRIWIATPPTTVVVEPKAADCLYQSALIGRPAKSQGDLDTVMACLSAGEVSLLAWEILCKSANFFMTLSDSVIGPAMKRLAEEKIIAGESGAATLAGFTAICSDQQARERLHINDNSQILLISTEGATDPQIYQQLVGINPKELSPTT